MISWVTLGLAAFSFVAWVVLVIDHSRLEARFDKIDAAVRGEFNKVMTEKIHELLMQTVKDLRAEEEGKRRG